MPSKKFDLEKNLAKKLDGQRKGPANPGRFAEESAKAPDRREQRRLDSAAGLVPFACKLPADLVDVLRQRAVESQADFNALIADVLKKGLAK